MGCEGGVGGHRTKGGHMTTEEAFKKGDERRETDACVGMRVLFRRIISNYMFLIIIDEPSRCRLDFQNWKLSFLINFS